METDRRDKAILDPVSTSSPSEAERSLLERRERVGEDEAMFRRQMAVGLAIQEQFADVLAELAK